MRRINRRKSHQSLITHVRGRGPGKLGHRNSWNPHLGYHLQLKTKEDVGSSRLWLQKGGRQYTWKQKSKYLVNKCLPALQRQWTQSGRWSLGRVLPPHPARVLCRHLWWLLYSGNRTSGASKPILPFHSLDRTKVKAMTHQGCHGFSPSIPPIFRPCLFELSWLNPLALAKKQKQKTHVLLHFKSLFSGRSLLHS